jgi:DNA-binding HxlR family transcriptional regulator
MEDEIELTQRTLDKITDKWTIRILCALSEDQSPVRFNELKRRVGGITQKVLSQHLRRLVRSGLLERRVQTGGVLAVEYAVTPLGETLREPLSVWYDWAQANAEVIHQSEAEFDRNGSDAEPRQVLAGLPRDGFRLP